MLATTGSRPMGGRNSRDGHLRSDVNAPAVVTGIRSFW